MAYKYNKTLIYEDFLNFTENEEAVKDVLRRCDEFFDKINLPEGVEIHQIEDFIINNSYELPSDDDTFMIFDPTCEYPFAQMVTVEELFAGVKPWWIGKKFTKKMSKILSYFDEYDLFDSHLISVSGDLYICSKNEVLIYSSYDEYQILSFDDITDAVIPSVVE